MDRQVRLCPIAKCPQGRGRREAVVGLEAVARPVDHQIVIGIRRAGVAKDADVVRLAVGDRHGDAFVVRKGLRTCQRRPAGVVVNLQVQVARQVAEEDLHIQHP